MVPHLVAYDDTWEVFDALPADCLPPSFCERNQDAYGGNCVYSWVRVGHVGAEVNAERPNTRYLNICEHCRAIMKKEWSQQDGLYFDVHPHSSHEQAPRCATRWWSSSRV